MGSLSGGAGGGARAAAREAGGVVAGEEGRWHHCSVCAESSSPSCGFFIHLRMVGPRHRTLLIHIAPSLSPCSPARLVQHMVPCRPPTALRDSDFSRISNSSLQPLALPVPVVIHIRFPPPSGFRVRLSELSVRESSRQDLGSAFLGCRD